MGLNEGRASPIRLGACIRNHSYKVERLMFACIKGPGFKNHHRVGNTRWMEKLAKSGHRWRGCTADARAAPCVPSALYMLVHFPCIGGPNAYQTTHRKNLPRNWVDARYCLLYQIWATSPRRNIPNPMRPMPTPRMPRWNQTGCFFKSINPFLSRNGISERKYPPPVKHTSSWMPVQGIHSSSDKSRPGGGLNTLKIFDMGDKEWSPDLKFANAPPQICCGLGTLGGGG